MNDALLTRLLGDPTPLTLEEAGARLRAARSVLLVKPHHKLGDLLVATPLIRNLRLALPRARLVVVAGPYNAPAVLDSPDLDAVEIARLKGPAAPFHGIRLARRLREERFDAGLVLSTIAHSASAVVLARRAAPAFLAGLDSAPSGSPLARLGYDCVVPPPDDLRLHIVDYGLTLLERLGIPVSTREHVLGVTPAQRARAEAILAGAGVDLARPILGVQVGGTPHRPERQWAPANYATVLQRAASDLDYQPVLLGRTPDRPALDEVRSLGRRPVPTLVDLPFAEYKGVLSRLTYFLTHDGGPVHVAAGVGVPSYFVFLSTPPWRWAPYGARFRVWEEFGRIPAASEVWNRLRPLLVRAAAGDPPR